MNDWLQSELGFLQECERVFRIQLAVAEDVDVLQALQYRVVRNFFHFWRDVRRTQ